MSIRPAVHVDLHDPRYPDRVRALVLLEAAAMSLFDGEARAYHEALRDRIEAAAAKDPSSVTETLYREVLGDAKWESFPEDLRRSFADNSPAVLASSSPVGPRRRPSGSRRSASRT